MLPLVGQQSASAVPPAAAYSGEAYGVGIFGAKVLNGLVTVSNTKLGQVGPFNGANPQSGDTGIISINQTIAGIGVKALTAHQTVTEGNDSSSASSELQSASVAVGPTSLVKADVATARTSADCSSAPKAGGELVNLSVAGIKVADGLSPNTVITVNEPLTHNVIATVTLKKQSTSSSANHFQASSSAVEVSFPAGGALNAIFRGTIVISHAESDVTCTAALTNPPVFVGYAFDVSPPPFFPTPWAGSPNTNFVGNPCCPIDAGAIRLDNPTGAPVTGVKVTVDIGTIHYDLWGVQTIPAFGRLILTQTTPENFDTSDAAAGPCGNPSQLIPVVTVTINGVTTQHYDNQKVLTTHGVDALACTGREGEQWTTTTP